MKLPFPKEPYIGDEMRPMSEDDWDPNWDSWEKADAVRRLSTKTYEIRHDIRVEAHGVERGVRVILKGDVDTGPRNVSTMRELALAILDACDFVEEKNPRWAARRRVES
jgi:hypothetical protein